MNLIEALKSGLPFKRKDKVSWLHPAIPFLYSKEDVLVDDYETKPPEKKMKKVKVWKWQSPPFKGSDGWCITQTDSYSEGYGYDGWTRIESSMIEIEVPEEE